jgi:glycosyltransferase involved in cell wall biosynthesis
VTQTNRYFDQNNVYLCARTVLCTLHMHIGGIMNNSTNEIELSIVATIYNDAAIVPLLVDEITSHCKQLKVNFEIILVNDFSTDDSEKEIEKICLLSSKIKGITLSRNFGQQIAMSVGMRYAAGKYVVIMDGDMQNPPSEIPRLYNEILKGYDIVYTVSKTRNNIFDKLTSFLFWTMLTKILGVKIVKNQLMMKIMNRAFVERYNEYNETHRTVTGIVRDISSHYQVLYIENQIRKIGKSNYNVIKRYNLMIDMLISLSNTPLNIMIFFGLIIFLFTNLVSIYYIILYLFLEVPPGFTSIILSIFFFGSLIVLLLGFIGRYLSNIYTEVRRRPLFHIKRAYNIEI